jgi:hypothetical protein
MLENKKVAHALVYDKDNIGIDETIRKSLKVFYKRNLFIDELKFNPGSCIIEKSVDECITTASNLGFDFLILTWEGNIFNIYDFHEEALKSINRLENQTNSHWVVAGHIMDQYQNRILYNSKEAELYKNSFFLFPITALVNINKWKEIGCPIWGESADQVSVVKGIPSIENIHDTYTPLKLDAGEEICQTRVRSGWNIINESLKSRIPVFNIDVDLRKTQNYLYPENDVNLYNDFWTHMHGLPKLKQSYEKVFSQVISCKFESRINISGWAYFLRNTEEPWPESKSENLPELSDYECMILPCSGFKDFIVSEVFLKVNKKIKLIHYDILEPCVSIKRRIIEQWDGSRLNLTLLLKNIHEDYKAKGKNNCFHMNFMKSLDEVYDQILPYFETEENLQKCWKDFQNFDHEYFHLDILDDRDIIFKISQSVKNYKTYFSLSDVAAWRMNLLGYSVQDLRNNMLFAITSIIQNRESSIIDYKDPATDIQHLHLYQDSIQNLSSDYEI